MKGSKLTDAEKSEMAKELSRYTGLSEDYFIKANLRVNLPQFMKELQRSRGLTTDASTRVTQAGATTCSASSPNTIRKTPPLPGPSPPRSTTTFAMS